MCQGTDRTVPETVIELVLQLRSMITLTQTPVVRTPLVDSSAA